MRFWSVRVWASIGLLVIAAGMPYCAAALGWAATQDATTVRVRADVAVGVFVSWIGLAILVVTGALVAWRMWRSRREGVPA
jgi:hypothetical protein